MHEKKTNTETDAIQTETRQAQYESDHDLGVGALCASIARMETAGTVVSFTLYNSVYEVTVAHIIGTVLCAMAGFVSITITVVL